MPPAEAESPAAEPSQEHDAPAPNDAITLEEVGAVGLPFVMVLNFGDSPTGQQVTCEYGDVCQAGLFTLHEDGTYTWRSHVRTQGDFGSGGEVSCDNGEWRQRHDEIVLVSCSGNSYQAPWEVESPERLRVGEYSLKVSGSGGEWSFPCDSTCEPFYGQFRP